MLTMVHVMYKGICIRVDVQQEVVSQRLIYSSIYQEIEFGGYLD